MQDHLHDVFQDHEIVGGSSINLILLSHAIKKPKSWVLAHGEYELGEKETQEIQWKIDRCLQGIPLPYILGTWDFFGKSFKVTPDVLIPRPETELLVDKAIEHLHRFPNAKTVDVGTGSGVIAISLAAECPSAKVLALDLSFRALQVAQENAKMHHQTQIVFLQMNLLSALQSNFDLIIANLPYIPSKTLQNLEVSKWEPRLALDGGESGLTCIKALLSQAHDCLASPGVILLEIEASLGSTSLETASAAFPNAHCQLYQDLAGNDRIIEISQP